MVLFVCFFSPLENWDPYGEWQTRIASVNFAVVAVAKISDRICVLSHRCDPTSQNCIAAIFSLENIKPISVIIIYEVMHLFSCIDN